jgi:drug/metabolite transporter (DMT)-like permease
MSPLAVGAVLGAALLHATWNAVLRGRADRLWSITVMSLMSGALGAVAVVLLPHPAAASWPFIALSATLQIAYCVALVRAYRDGLLAEIYPIARGSSPLLVTLGAWLLAGERLSPAAMGGIVLVSAGIIGIAFGRARLEMRSLLAALATGVLIAAYTVTDGLGSRLSGAAPSYAAWLFLAQGAPMPLVYFAIRRSFPPLALDGDTLKSMAGGAFSLVAYGVVIWALSRSPMGQVSALRETGIVFAMLIGVLFLKERPTPRQILAGAVITVGAFLLASAGT